MQHFIKKKSKKIYLSTIFFYFFLLHIFTGMVMQLKHYIHSWLLYLWCPVSPVATSITGEGKNRRITQVNIHISHWWQPSKKIFQQDQWDGEKLKLVVPLSREAIVLKCCNLQTGPVPALADGCMLYLWCLLSIVRQWKLNLEVLTLSFCLRL